MRRPLQMTAVAASLLAIVAAVVVTSPAATAKPPFYFIPQTPRKECHGVKDCISQIGPWVVVPAHAEATFLLVCPQKKGFFGGTVAGGRHGFVGGTDTRASSPNVQVWFDGQIGSPISQSITTGGSLLFHAITTNGKAETFEPVIGCITLARQTNGRSTVSARRASAVPGTSAAAPLDLHASNVVLIAGTAQTVSVSCPANENLVSSWSSLAFATSDPPRLSHVKDVTVKTTIVGRRMRAVIDTAGSLPFVPLAEVQVGAACAQ